MKNVKTPNPNKIFSTRNAANVAYVKPTITNPNVIVGDFTYFADVDFEKHVTHHYDFYGDKLIIPARNNTNRFCAGIGLMSSLYYPKIR